MNQLDYQALAVVYSNFKAKFDNLLEKCDSFSIRQRNIQKLAIAIFTFSNGLSHKIMNEVSQIQSLAIISLSDKNKLYSRNRKTEIHGTESTLFLMPKIQFIFPQNIKDLQILFKKHVEITGTPEQGGASGNFVIKSLNLIPVRRCIYNFPETVIFSFVFFFEFYGNCKQAAQQ